MAREGALNRLTIRYLITGGQRSQQAVRPGLVSYQAHGEADDHVNGHDSSDHPSEHTVATTDFVVGPAGKGHDLHGIRHSTERVR